MADISTNNKFVQRRTIHSKASNPVTPIKYYVNADICKKDIVKDNKNKIGFTLNGELLMDALGGETTFADVQGDGFVPAFTFGVGQRAKLIFGQDVDTLKYFTTCGLQEGYEPFCVFVTFHLKSWQFE